MISIIISLIFTEQINIFQDKEDFFLKCLKISQGDGRTHLHVFQFNDPHKLSSKKLQVIN